MKVAIFASGNGSNFEAIMQAVAAKELEMEVVLLFSDQRESYVLNRAKKYQIPTAAFSPKEFDSRQAYEQAVLDVLQENQVDWIVLAGYMRIIGKKLLKAYPNRIINIHPSLLPAFPGLHGIKDAFEAGVSQTGVTIHFVDAGVDTGPIIAQGKVSVHSDDTLESLEERIHKKEHELYPKVLQQIIGKGNLDFKIKENRNLS
ncbi:phosphoribosylglycinamide formyltransferase [Vagococcus elongatus]|uniref:Phosphoribosylglycinamide formyltransferase n=1 Tax=Vagococcus elongatus TaxID=180344 RepID=A0A430AQK1_9ENTE|nr:phosphoribosylglycinamide formyltransferase [Vagococcus elongatus]RSU10336.1 phosphoribosylglycinamide formyltransferase [Vagococcus elongatus]